MSYGYGKNIKKRREELGMTQEELAKACGYQSKSSISKIEAEETDLTQSKLVEIANALRTTPGALFEPVKPKSKTRRGFKDTVIDKVLGIDGLDDDEREELFFDPYELYDSQELKFLFSNNLKILMRNDHINNATLANRLGVSESAVGKWLSGNILPRSNMQLKIADFFGIRHSDLFLEPEEQKQVQKSSPQIFSEKISAKLYHYPLLGTIAAGAPILADEHIEDYITLSFDVNADFALRVRGDSMIEANIFDGDIVFIHQQPTVENGEIAAVMLIDPVTSDAVATLKRVYQTPNGMQLVPENRNYAPIIVNEDNGEGAKILGKATYYITEAR